MQCSFGTSPGGNDEAVNFVHTVKSRVSHKDDNFNLDIVSGRALNASEPSLQIRTWSNWGSSHSRKSSPSPKLSLSRCQFSLAIENILLMLLNFAECFMRKSSMDVH